MKGTLFALARNRNDIDANEKLKSMLYQVEATGAAFIDGKNILADSIFARHIQTGSITTEHMTAGSIKGDRIEVGTLNGDRITANTITSNMIHTAGLDAGVIKAGIISAGNGVSVINMTNGEFSLAGGKMGYVAATDRLYLGMGTLYMGELPIEEHNRMVGNRDSALTKKTTLTNEKAQWDASYTGVYGNINLTGTPKTNLSGKYTAYGTAYTNVINALNAVINAPTNTSIAAFATLQGTADTMMTAYRTALSELTTALTAAEKAIAEAVAAAAQTAATNAAKTYTDNTVATLEAKATGSGKWIGKRYNKPDGVRVEPSFSVIKTLSLAEALEVADTMTFRFGMGATENYIGHWSTNVYVATAKTVSFSATHDDGFAVYLNGKRVAGTSLTTSTAFDLVFIAGWNQVDLLLHEISGGDQIVLNKLVGANVDQLSCYLGGSTTTAEVLDVTNSLNTLSTTMTGSFKDGLLTAAEKSAITAQKNSFVSEKSDLDAQYNSLKTKLTNLTLTTESNTLTTAYGTTSTNYVQKYTNLITALDAVIATPDTTSSATLATLKTAVTNAAAAYATQLGLFSTALEAANQSVADKLAANALASANQNTTNVVAETVPYSIVFSNENQSIPTDAVGVLKGSFIFGSDILVFRGSTRTSGTIGTVVLKDKDGIAVIATGGTISINVTQPTASITGKVEVLFSTGVNLSAEMGYLDVPITVNGVVYNKRMTWNKARDGQASRFYNLTLNTPSLQAIPGGGYSPATIGGSTSTSIGTDTIVSQSGYYLVYEQSRDSITLDAYNVLVAAGQVAIDREYIVSDVAYPFVKRYTSSATEYSFSYTPNENISMVLVEVYADSGFTNLLDYQSAPVIYEGQSAYGMQLTATNGLVFKFDQFNANKGMADTVLTPVLTNITDATYAWKLNGSATVSATTPTVTVGYSALNSVDSIKYLCEVSGTANGVPVTVSDTVTVSKVKDGSDTYNIILTNESVNIPTAENGSSPVLTGANTNVKLYYGTVAKTPTLTLSSQTGGTATIDGVDTTKVSIATVTADAGYIDILVKDGTTTVGTKRFSFARSKQGVSGRSITAVDVEYYLSTSSTAQADGTWSTTAPAWTSGKYMWSRTKTTYSTGSPTYSAAVCITGTAGQTGGIGTGITSITEEFYLSTSKTTQTGSSWGTAMPTWLPNTYMWTRSKIIYSNPTSTVYTTPLVDSSWEAVNEIKVGGANLVPKTKTLDGYSYKTTDTYLGMNIARTTRGTTGYLDTFSATTINIANSDVYTVSFYAKANVDTTINCHWYSPNTTTSSKSSTGYSGTSADGLATVSVTTEWKRYWVTWTQSATTAQKALIVGRNNTAANGTVEIAGVKLETGNKASEWTPAPEDVENQIETKAKTFTSTPVVPYNSGDIWKNGTTTYVSTVTRLTGSYTVGDWVKTGDITSENTAADTTNVGGTAATTIVTQAGNGAAAYTSVQDMSNDNKLTPLEKQDTLKEWNIITGEYAGILAEANRLGVTATTYTNAYNTLNGYIPGLVSNLTTTSDIVGTTFRTNFKNYYDARQSVLNSITVSAETSAKNYAELVGKALTVKGATDTYFDFDKNLTASNGTAPLAGYTATLTASGRFGKGVSLINQKLYYDKAVLPLTGFTITGWFKPITVHTSGTNNTGINTNWYFPLVEMAPTTNLGMVNYGFGLSLQPDDGVTYFRRLELRSPIVSTGSTSLNNGTWYHIAAVFNGSSYKVYLNGQLEINAVTATQPQVLSGAVFMVGGGYCGNNNLEIDDLLITSRILSQEDIRVAYTLAQPMHDPNPIVVASNPQGVTISIT